jgi:hypothetical protein
MVKIKFYPFNVESEGFAPYPEPALKMIPDWYKKQTSAGSDEDTLSRGFTSSTIKRCMPFFDLMTSGYMLLMPCDVYIDASNPEQLKHTAPEAIKDVTENLFSSHNREQYAELPYDRQYYHKDLLRINPLWGVSTPAGYSTIFVNPMYQDPGPLEAIGAMVDTDEYISRGHLSFFVKSGFVGVVKQGTPLVQIFPFKREPWQMERINAEQSEKATDRQFLKLRSTFINGYKNKMRSKKEYR